MSRRPTEQLVSRFEWEWSKYLRYAVKRSGFHSQRESYSRQTRHDGRYVRGCQWLYLSRLAIRVSISLTRTEDRNIPKQHTDRLTLLSNCCSHAGYCGSTSAYCGTGCQSEYGTCSGVSSFNPGGSPSSFNPMGGSSSSSSSSIFTNVVSSTITKYVTAAYPAITSSTSTASAVKSVSTNGNCGSGLTCQGSSFGVRICPLSLSLPALV